MKNVFKVGKSFLSQTARSRNLFFTITVLLLLFVSLQGQWSQLYAADKTEAPQKETAYPATPEGVVEAAHKMDYENAFPPNSPHYWAKELYCTADYGPVIKSFRVKRINQSKDIATVKVEFEVVGTFSPGYVGEKDDGGNTVTKPERDNFFDVLEPTGGKFYKGVIIYEVVKVDGQWKITPRQACPPVYMSIDATIKFIEHKMRFIKNDSIRKRNLKIIDLLKGLQKTNK